MYEIKNDYQCYYIFNDCQNLKNYINQILKFNINYNINDFLNSLKYFKILDNKTDNKIDNKTDNKIDNKTDNKIDNKIYLNNDELEKLDVSSLYLLPYDKHIIIFNIIYKIIHNNNNNNNYNKIKYYIYENEYQSELHEIKIKK